MTVGRKRRKENVFRGHFRWPRNCVAVQLIWFTVSVSGVARRVSLSKTILKDGNNDSLFSVSASQPTLWALHQQQTKRNRLISSIITYHLLIYIACFPARKQPYLLGSFSCLLFKVCVTAALPDVSFNVPVGGAEQLTCVSSGLPLLFLF